MQSTNVALLLVVWSRLLLLLSLSTITPTTAFSTRSSVFFSGSGSSSSRRCKTSPALLSSSSSSSSEEEEAKEENPPYSLKRLQDCVCLVTGASRGIGKGIALELASEGATVYVTGTSTSSSSALGDNTNNNNSNNITAQQQQNEPGTIEDTVNELNQAGGKGIGVICDHSDDGQVQKLFDQIAKEQNGQLDILINNAFRLPAGGVERLYGKFWKQGPEVWDTLHTVGLRSHFVASCFAMPLLLKAAASNNSNKKKKYLPRPFIGMVSSFGGLTYTFNVPYGVGKAGVDRLAKDMAIELRDENISVISFWPGLVDTERTQKAVANGEWDKYVKLPLDNAETPRFTGRAVVATALDSNSNFLQTKSGTYQVVAELAQEYGFTDVDGITVPPSIRSLRFLIPTYASDKFPKQFMDNIPDWKLPFWIMAQGQPPPS
mmetsp:Transcript_20674/g.26681  ORF Transcript_20674/g.26681 Transcript_20674/m.26681 type:complete len:433 (-) Transcript_20674:35-1333(-)